MEVKKVLYNKTTKQKYIIIPKNSNLNVGDYVKIEKIENGRKEKGD